MSKNIRGLLQVPDDEWLSRKKVAALVSVDLHKPDVRIFHGKWRFKP